MLRSNTHNHTKARSQLCSLFSSPACDVSRLPLRHSPCVHVWLCYEQCMWSSMCTMCFLRFAWCGSAASLNASIEPYLLYIHPLDEENNDNTPHSFIVGAFKYCFHMRYQRMWVYVIVCRLDWNATTVDSTLTRFSVSLNQYIRIKTADPADALIVCGIERMWKTPKQLLTWKIERESDYICWVVFTGHTQSLHTYIHSHCVLYIVYITQIPFSRSPPGKNKRDIFTRPLSTLYTLCFHSCRARAHCKCVHSPCTHAARQGDREGDKMYVHICAVHCNEIECTRPSTFAHVVKFPILPADGNTRRVAWIDLSTTIIIMLCVAFSGSRRLFSTPSSSSSSCNLVCLNILRHGIYCT